MTEFTLRNWQDVLAKVFALAVTNPRFRETCLRHPREAVAEVSDIDLPAYFKFDFVDHKEQVVYSYALPPLLHGIRPDEDREIQGAIREVAEFLLHCTEPTTGR